MSMNIKFIFNGNEYQILVHPNDYELFPNKVFISLLNQNQYEVKSNTSNEVFQSLIQYFIDKTQPNTISMNMSN